jgi:hypothetical protein
LADNDLFNLYIYQTANQNGQLGDAILRLVNDEQYRDYMSQNHLPGTPYQRVRHIAKTKAVFLFLLPFFFVLHGFIANYEAVNAIDAFLLFVVYIVIVFIFVFVGWLFYHHLLKASLFAFAIMSFHFFFGYLQDILKDIAPGSVVSQYRFLLPFGCLALVLLVIALKKQVKPMLTLTMYLNVVLFVLILIDAWALIAKIARIQRTSSLVAKEHFITCDTCKTPDIYFILLDQYAGSESLREVFNFDNSPFEEELEQRGFHVAKRTNSNYNLTPFSMASILDMNYLNPNMSSPGHLSVNYSYSVIRNAQAISFFSRQGYKFYNLSVFDFPGQPANKYRAFFPYGTDLITAQTLVGRLKKAARADILSGKLPLKSFQHQILYEQLHFNDDVFKLTRETAAEKSTRPKFAYSHFIMPHWPYYFDSKGQPMRPEKLQGFHETNAQDYIEYLQYCNKQILKLVDDLFAKAGSPPIIILLSDHGFRHPEKKTDHKFDFSNLNAIYLPEKNYSQFSDGMTNVNFFRVLFNTCFNQHFPLLKDTTINLW